MVFAAVTFLAGILLARHFKMLALVPASALTVMLAIGIGSARADPVVSMACTVFSAIIALQLGYLVGLVIRHVLVAARTGREATPYSSSPSSR